MGNGEWGIGKTRLSLHDSSFPTFCTRAERCRSSDSLFSILHSLFPAPMPDILIADDHPLFRDALQRAVLAALPQARVHSADSVHALLGLIEQFPDAELLLLDLHMPGAHGYSALAHGASAYIPKSSGGTDIASAIRAVLDGDVWLPPTMLGQTGELKPDEAAAAVRIAALTPQQFRVMSMIAEGLLNKQIARELGVSEATVKAHMTAIMRKLGVNNRTQVALIASHLAVDPDGLPALPQEAR